MSASNSVNNQLSKMAVERRKVLTAAAWTVPVIAVAISAPSAAASETASPVDNYNWYFAQNQVGSVRNREVVAATNINVNKADASLPDVPFTVIYTITYTVFSDAGKTTEIVSETKTFDPVLYSGSNQDTSPELSWKAQLTAEQWPPNGGYIWVEYHVISAIATTVAAPVQTVSIAHTDGYGSTNPNTASGYVSSW